MTSIDSANDDVVDTVRFADHPFMAKMASGGIDLHMGVLLGLVSQAAVFVLAATLVVMMIVTGYRMWWQCRPTGGHTLRKASVRRGAWRSLPPVATAGLVLLVAARTTAAGARPPATRAPEGG